MVLVEVIFLAVRLIAEKLLEVLVFYEWFNGGWENGG